VRAVERMLSLWNIVTTRGTQEYRRQDIALADELIQALRKESGLHNPTELRACRKFFGNTLHQQMVAIGKEFQEVHYAYMGLADPNCKGQEAYMNLLAEELVDLQTACETLLVILGTDIDKVRREVIEKNSARGYYQASEKEASS
jgi:hypothetical protein